MIYDSDTLSFPACRNCKLCSVMVFYYNSPTESQHSEQKIGNISHLFSNSVTKPKHLPSSQSAKTSLNC